MLLAFIGFEIGLSMSGGQIWALIIFIGVMGLLFYFLLQTGKRGSTMEAAKQFAADFWKKNYGEELSREDAMGVKGCFGNEATFYGFKLKRQGGPKAGQFVVINVERTPGGFDIAKFSDKPTPDEIEDPFKILDGFLFRTPVATAEPMPKYLANQLPYRTPQISVNVGQEKKQDEFKKMGGS